MQSVFVNGKPDNTIDALDRGLAYGDGAFATMRVAAGEILFLNTHLQRIEQTCFRLGFTISHIELLVLRLESHAKTLKEGCIKLLLSRGVGGRGYAAPTSPDITEVISLHPIPDIYAQWQSKGITLSLSPVTLGNQPLLAGMKHLNRLEQVLIKQQTLPKNTDDWLVLDADNCLVESSMANIFIVKDNQVKTPAMSQNGVSGVMREHVIDALLTNDIAVMATKVTLDELLDAEHVFITNSLLGVVNVNSINIDSINSQLSSSYHYKTWNMTHTLLTQLKLSF
ncbi:aminodeoxychorismate lyase [Shewanella electrodiphila]|uniref:Aminodeoxychorismate lyase n=1 Tax=Shewanella electrodiphila TaxID=934143 RepID=A0ABT0KMW1_9GAMM|nr:aminodeoxychorismate lyase [Shewanella electrodiphila]MCL1045187.1 aminodeoxychorismate lyase [Shewanella electrodiphila]